jgi:cellulose synthase/poly-beta-1,6-N-acetylglucosamine synthase-like glycosyltransferase
MSERMPLEERVSDANPTLRQVSVIMPVRDEAASIGDTVASVLAQAPPGVSVEVVVVDDGSSDETSSVAAAAGAVVVRTGTPGVPGNPAAARNLGVRRSQGDPLIFLDADCTPEPGWLEAILDAHASGEVVVGGPLELPPGLSWSARCDYYCGWYHVHARRKRGTVPNHPPGNLSVRREAFLSTDGFIERQPIAFAHEELVWQAQLQREGHRILFVPEASVLHHNRPGFGNLLRRNYRWAYSSLESKAETGAARMPWLYSYPRSLMLLGAPMAIAQSIYIVGCWVRAGRLEPMAMFPVVLSARVAYAAGMVVGGIRWLREREGPAVDRRPRWE